MLQAIYHGKPVVAMPIFGDQPTNADRVVAKVTPSVHNTALHERMPPLSCRLCLSLGCLITIGILLLLQRSCLRENADRLTFPRCCLNLRTCRIGLWGTFAASYWYLLLAGGSRADGMVPCRGSECA